MDATKRTATQHRNELYNKWLRLTHELASIEEEVGLRDSNGIARYEPIFWDQVRERYLAIVPPDKRRVAIKLWREIHACQKDLYKADVVCAGLYLLAAEGTGRYLKEIIPPVMGILLVWLGSELFGMTGAIAGAVAGIFMGLSYIRKKDDERRRRVTVAKTGVATSEKMYNELVQAREPFAASDEQA